MYEIWYDYVELKNGEKTKLSCMDTGRSMVHIKIRHLRRHWKRCLNKILYLKL